VIIGGKFISDGFIPSNTPRFLMSRGRSTGQSV